MPTDLNAVVDADLKSESADEGGLKIRRSVHRWSATVSTHFRHKNKDLAHWFWTRRGRIVMVDAGKNQPKI